MDPGNQGSARCVLLTHPGGPGGRAGARAPPGQPAESVAPPAGGRAASGGMTRRAPRPSARRPAWRVSPFASFVLPSLLPNFLPGLSALLLLASFSLGGGGVRVRGWHAVSFILRDLFWPTASRAYLPLARSLPPDFVLSSFRSRVLRPASPPACRGRAVAAISRGLYCGTFFGGGLLGGGGGR